MPDYTGLCAEWREMLSRRRALGEALSLWTPVLEGWRDWDDRGVAPLMWTGEECRQRWERGVPLLADAAPAVSPESLEDLLGPLMERLAVGSPAAAEALGRFAAAWDEGTVGPASLFPTSGKGGAAALEEELGMPPHLVGFLAHAGLRPALEAWFTRVRALPEGGWDLGFCPWCGGMPSYGDLMEDGRWRLSCHLCGGAWAAARLRCPFCKVRQSSDMVRLVAEGAEEGYFVEACLLCRGYLKGLDRRERSDGASPLAEDWASPHLDYYAGRQGYWRASPSLAQLLPAAGEEPAP
jgi:Protein involved in formate dehydrogenase formation